MTLTPTTEQKIETAANLLSNSYIAYLNNVSRFRPNFTIESFPHSGHFAAKAAISSRTLAGSPGPREVIQRLSRGAGQVTASAMD